MDSPNKANKEPKKKQKTKISKVTLILCLLFALLTALAVSVPFLIPEKRVKDELIKAFTKKSGFLTDIKSIKLSLYTGGLTLNDLSFSEKGKKEFAIIKRATLKVPVNNILSLILAKDIEIEQIVIEQLSVNMALLPKEIKPETLTNNNNAPTPAETPQINNQTPILNFKIVKINNATLYSLAKSPLKLSNINLNKINKTEVEFLAQGTIGGDSGSFDFDGKFTNFSLRDILNSEFVGSLKIQGIKIAEFTNKYSLLESGTLSGKADINVSREKSTITSKIIGKKISLWSKGNSAHYPDATYNFKLSFDHESSMLNILDFNAIADKEGSFQALGNIDFNDPQNITSNITVKESALPWSLISELSKIPHYKHFARGMFYYSGTSYFSKDKIDISGKVYGSGINLKLASNDTDFDFKTDIQLTKDFIDLPNLSFATGANKASGSVRIKFAEKNPLKKYSGTLNIDTDLKPFSLLLGQDGDLQGRVAGEIAFSEDAAKSTSNVKVLLRSNNPVVASNAALGKINIGKVAIDADITSPSNTTFRPYGKIKISSLPLVANVNGGYKGEVAGFGYGVRISPALLFHISKHDFFKKHINAISLQGKATYKEKSGEVHISNNTIAGTLIPLKGDKTIPFNVTGNFDYNLKSHKLSSPDTIVKISHNVKKPLEAKLSYDLSLGSDNKNDGFVFKPEGTLALRARSDVQHISDTLIIGGIIDKPIPVKAPLALTMQVKHNSGVSNITTAYNSGAYSIGEPVLFRDKSSSGTLVAKYNHASEQLNIVSLKVKDKAELISLQASGIVYPSRMIFEKLNLSSRFTIEKLSNCLQGRLKTPMKLTGNIQLNSEITGSLDNPRLLINGSAPSVFIEDRGYLRQLFTPKITAELSWERKNDMIHNLVLNDFKYFDKNESLIIKGRSDQLNLKEGGVVNFGKGCAFSFILRGNRNLLGVLFPETKQIIQSPGKMGSVALSAVYRAKELPLFRFGEKERYSVIRKSSIDDGKFFLEKLNIDKARISDISGNFSLKDSIFTLKNGSAVFGGKMHFASEIDFLDTPARGSAKIYASNLDVTKSIDQLNFSTRFTRGLFSIPWPQSEKFAAFMWEGSTIDEIISTIKTPVTGMHTSDLEIVTIVKKPDWKQLLKDDLPESVVTEIAARLDKQLGHKYGKETNIYYKYFDVNYRIKDQQVELIKASCGGGNTADFEAYGKIWFNGKLDLKIIPIKNINKTADISLLTEMPMIKGIIDNLPPESKAQAKRILPEFLEELCNKKKIFIKVGGTIEKPEVDPSAISKEIKANIPMLINRFNSTIGPDNLFKGLLGEDLKEVDKLINGGSDNKEIEKALEDLF